jgi:hypothetical protein
MEGSTLEKHTVYVSHIDNRMVKCSCGEEKCKIGLNFDGGDGKEVMRLTDKFGNEHTMCLSEQNINDTLERLLEARRCLRKHRRNSPRS